MEKNRVGVREILFFVSQSKFNGPGLFGKTHGSPGLVQQRVSIPWWVTSLFLGQFLRILPTG